MKTIHTWVWDHVRHWDHMLIVVKLLYMKNILQRVSVCVVTHLISQNSRAVCKRHGLSWRCIQCGEAHSASCSVASWAGHGYWARASRKLGLRASSEVRGSLTVLCHTCLKRPVHWSGPRMSLASETTQLTLASWTTEPLAKREAR